MLTSKKGRAVFLKKNGGNKIMGRNQTERKKQGKGIRLTALVIGMILLSGCGSNKSQTVQIKEGKNQVTKIESNTVNNESENNDKNPFVVNFDKELKETLQKQEKNQLELTFSQEGGFYPEDFQLEISCEGAKNIYYTLDGSDPLFSNSRILYEEPIRISAQTDRVPVMSQIDPFFFDAAHVELNQSKDGFVGTLMAPKKENVDQIAVVRAVAEDKKETYSKTQTESFFLGTMEEHIQGIAESCEAAGQDLAVLSLSINYEDLFDYDTGIYVKGAHYQNELKKKINFNEKLDEEVSRALNANYKQKGREWEREIHLELFEASQNGATQVLSQSCGIRVQGNYSRSDLQKGLRLYARSEYGDKNFKYAVFGENLTDDQGQVMEKFKTLTLRAGGNTALTAKYNDTYWQTLVKDLDCETLASRPCIVYVNGEYWGLYVLQEDYSDDYFQDTHGVNKDQVVVYKGDAEALSLGYKLDVGELPEGETNESYYFEDLLNFFQTHKNLEAEEDFQAFSQLVDVESARDYFAAQIWINNKWDWPGKNWSLWRTTEADKANPYADKKWRFCFYDLDFGGVMGANEANANTIKEDNYKPAGMLDMDTNNPAVLIFAYLMTNENFREDYKATLLGLSEGYFEKEHAQTILNQFRDTYAPLYDQFFLRYPGSGSSRDALSGGYSSYKCMYDFLEKRADYIQPMITYIDEHFQ